MQMTRPASRPTPAWVVGTHIFIVAVFGGAAVHAQVQPAGRGASGRAPRPRGRSAATPAWTSRRQRPMRCGCWSDARRSIDVGDADCARVADQRRHRRRARHRRRTSCWCTARCPGAISMFVWSRGGAVRRYEVVGAARPGAADRAGQAAVPEREASTSAATAATSCCRASCRARMSSIAPSTSRRLRREARGRRHAAAGARRAGRATRCCCACGSPK